MPQTINLLLGVLCLVSAADAQLAAGKTKWLGSVYSPTQVEGFTQYWNQVTPENAGKWASVEAVRDRMNWRHLDAAYALAKDKGYPFRFHVLVWGAQQPGWIDALPPADQLAEIEEWFRAVADRYPEIDYLEVVNEPLHQRPDGETGEADYWDALGGPGATGWDWVIRSFEMAREIFPASTRLMINEYGIVNSGSNLDAYGEIIQLLKDRDLIDRIGVQAHAFSNGGCNAGYCGDITAASLTENLHALAELDLPIQVTELDIDGNPALGEEGSDAVQLGRYQRIFPALWEHPAVEGITLWGWRPGLWRSDQEAYIFTQRPRPAMDWLEDYLAAADGRATAARVPSAAAAPEGFELMQNYPNPFNSSTRIRYRLARASSVSVVVYDVAGRRVERLVDARQSAGTHAVSFDASELASGLYLCRIEAGEFADVKRMTLIR